MAQKEISESIILGDICRYLESEKVFFFRLNNVPVKGRSLGKWVPKGLPDIVCIRHGTFVGLEVKRPAGFYKNRNRPVGLLREDQKQFGDKLWENGGEYYVVTSVDDVRRMAGLGIR